MLLLRNADAKDTALVASAQAVAAPEYLHIELVSACRRLVIGRHLEEKDALARLGEFADFPIVRFDTYALESKIMGLRSNFSAYDAGYVALAEILDIPFMSYDLRLRRAVAAHTKVQLT
jgi:predicted nucleic acid-binding protein